ncbi:MAG: DNA-binding response regulator [Proteobacteria bacterium]|nr:MAG: DNA-binding response regulator [Pseudomonadota bacterium]
MTPATDAAPSGGAPIRILLVDDHPLVREGVRMLVEAQPDMDLRAESADRVSALAALRRERPDLILLDLDLGADDGLDLLRELLRLDPDLRVLVFTGLRDRELHQRAVELGALGVVPKEQATSVLLAAIRKVHAGEAWIDRKVVASLLQQARRAPQQSDPEQRKIAALTARERELVALVAQGNGTRRLSERLGITDKTIRNHLVSIYAKLGVSDRLELAVYAGRHGLAAPPESTAGH